MALAGAALILKVEDERSPYQALILNLSEQYVTCAGASAGAVARAAAGTAAGAATGAAAASATTIAATTAKR